MIDETHLDETAERLRRRPAPAARSLRDDLRVSFEFFPPASERAETTLWRTVETLAPLRPTFVSMTYGAGGTTRDRTLRQIQRLCAETTLDTAAHLTSVGATSAEVHSVVDDYVAAGVRRIVALRGDPQPDRPNHADGFADAAELVASLVDRGEDLDISVAAYPETHPMATSAQADLANLKRKLDAGANRALTQFFFDADTYLVFLDRCRASGISAPIVPGIMPITHFERICGFAKRCGTEIPGWLSEVFDGLDEAPEIRDLVAVTIAAEQCQRLIDNGVRDFHFYTMNRADLTAAVCRLLGLRASADALVDRQAS